MATRRRTIHICYDRTKRIFFWRAIDIVEECIKDSEEVMDDEFFGENYDKEWALKDHGKREGIREIARKMKEHNISIDEISEITGLSIEDINKL